MVKAIQPGGSMLQNIPDKIVVFIKFGKVIMTSSMYPYQYDPFGVDLLKGFTMGYRDQPVIGSM